MADFRIEKAKRFLSAAEDDLRDGHLESCVSRAYYAAYHLMIVLLEEKANISRRRWEHTGVVNQFREHFTNKGYLFAEQEAEDLQSLLNERVNADYHDYTSNQRHVERSLTKAKDLCEKVLGVLENA